MKLSFAKLPELCKVGHISVEDIYTDKVWNWPHQWSDDSSYWQKHRTFGCQMWKGAAAIGLHGTPSLVCIESVVSWAFSCDVEIDLIDFRVLNKTVICMHHCLCLVASVSYFLEERPKLKGCDVVMFLYSLSAWWQLICNKVPRSSIVNWYHVIKMLHVRIIFLFCLDPKLFMFSIS